mgnify:FL=1
MAKKAPTGKGHFYFEGIATVILIAAYCALCWYGLSEGVKAIAAMLFRPWY